MVGLPGIYSLPRVMRIITATTAGRTLLISLVLYGLVFQYCRWRFWRDPHSAFFDDKHVYDLQYSLYREHEAAQYLSAYNAESEPPPAPHAVADPVMCVAVATVKRDQVNYFEAAVGSLLQGLDPRERAALSVNVVFVDTDPSKHPSWGQRWMDRLVDSVGTYNVTREDMERLRSWEESHNYYEKGVFDYMYLLDNCYHSGSPYIALFEDDIIFADGWLAKTFRALAEIKERSISPGQDEGWLYLRLFYTETALSWTTEDFWYRNMPLAFIITSSVAFGALSFTRRAYPSSRRYLDNLTVAVICLVTVPAFTALVFMIGKYNVHPMNGVVEMNRYGCCTQGMVFPRNQIPDLLHFLRERSGQTDALIEEYADTTHLRRFALSPPQLQHVGIRSSRDNLEINTKSTWAFWFETNDPLRLRKEHDRLLQTNSIPWI